MKILFSVFTLLCFFSIQFFPNKTFAQDKFTLSGYVKDSVSGESLIAASVFIKNNGQGAYTNEFGFYSITLPSGNYEVIFSYVGFISFERNIQLNQDTRLNINLSPKASTLNEVVIETEKKDANVNDAEMGKIELKMERIKTIPAIFGEVDIMKTIQLLPGVQGGTEGTSGFYVRGGGPDQNLVLLDNATVYNTGHLFGFFSVFNADAINSSTLYKGGMPAEYGGRLSSVLDVSMRDG
ncbi:MAG TPA: TonB-dependent receptor, partial [Bacteroidetes bacterium]|nr:TonB-dependent receptor [Bacteroidota bacterium]